jgi:hypothetical protein
MKSSRLYTIFILFCIFFNSCTKEKEIRDYSGTYCLNIGNLDMTILQEEEGITFSVSNNVLMNGTGTFFGDTLILAASTTGEENFNAHITFAEDGLSFQGPYQVEDTNGTIKQKGILEGMKGSCPTYDIDSKGIPRFVEREFTELSKIEMISRFRSGFGHSFTDGTESCRSMKHYYAPYEKYLFNNTVQIFSPVTGTIIAVPDDGHGASLFLTNKQVHIRSDDQPAFVFVIFHCDLAASEYVPGYKVHAGQQIGYARLYYEDLAEYATCFDIAVRASTPSGTRLVSFFDVMSDSLFNDYELRGIHQRKEFIISKEERDADPLECNGETFITSGNLENWVIF